MKLTDRIKIALRAFRASPAIYNLQSALYDGAMGGLESRTILDTAQQDFYKKSAHIYSCIKIRADAIARPPLRVFKRGNAEPLLTHPLQKLLNKPTLFHTRSSLQRRIELSLLTWGNMLVGIEFDKLGRPFELWPMRPDWARVEPHRTNFIDKYVYNVGGVDIDYAPKEIIHFQYEDPFNQYWGLTPLSAARLAGEFGIDAMTSNRIFFKNFAMPATGLVTKEPVTEQQAKEILARWNAALAGATQQHKALVLGAVEPKALTINPKDAEWLAGMKFSLGDASRVFRVPMPLVGEDSAVYKNIADAEAALWHETLVPELMSFEEVWNQELVPLFNEPDLYVAYDLSSVEALQEDVNKASERHERYVVNGIKTINEIRTQELNKGPVSWGDVWHRPTNLASVDEPSVPVDTTQTQKYALNDVSELNTLFFDFLDKERHVIADAYSKQARQAYDWGRWYRLLGMSFATGIQKQFGDAMRETSKDTGVEISFELANQRADSWAKTRAGELLMASKRYPESITEETRRVVNNIITEGIKAGESVNDLRVQIADNPIFSSYRSEMIARTETQRAYNKGNMEGYRASGVVTRKRWLVMGDACDECTGNANDDIIAFEDGFSSGHTEPPAHPNCLCRVLPIVSDTIIRSREE